MKEIAYIHSYFDLPFVLLLPDTLLENGTPDISSDYLNIMDNSGRMYFPYFLCYWGQGQYILLFRVLIFPFDLLSSQ
jgi:hypothetical protein